MQAARNTEYHHQEEALRALEDAWAWLRAKALVAYKPDQSHEAARFIDGWNDRCHPFTWTRTPEDVLRYARNRQVTSDAEH